jgi:hypothetical protein
MIVIINPYFRIVKKKIKTLTELLDMLKPLRPGGTPDFFFISNV